MGDVHIGLGLTIGCVEDALVELLLGATAELTDCVTTGAEASDLLDFVEMERIVVLDLTRVADLGLVEVRVDAGRTVVDAGMDPSSIEVVVGRDPSSVGTDVGEDPSSDVAEPSSLAEVVAAGSSEVTGASPLPAVVVSEDPESPLSEEPEPESSPPESDPASSPELEVGFGLVDEDLLDEMPLPTVPMTEDENFVPLFELDKVLVPDLEAELLEKTLLPDLLETADDLVLELDSCVELLTDVPILDEVFAVSLLHATPMQGRVDELEVGGVLFAEAFDDDQGFSVSLLHG